MPNTVFYIIIAYFAVISIVAVCATVKDKNIAKRNEPLVKKYGKNYKKLERRIPERTLLTIAALGGSAAMLITMKKIRHKTQHKKFMVGIPAIIAAQVIAIIGIVLLVVK